jgi:hypothetical protein
MWAGTGSISTTASTVCMAASSYACSTLFMTVTGFQLSSRSSAFHGEGRFVTAMLRPGMRPTVQEIVL